MTLGVLINNLQLDVHRSIMPGKEFCILKSARRRTAVRIRSASGSHNQPKQHWPGLAGREVDCWSEIRPETGSKYS